MSNTKTPVKFQIVSAELITNEMMTIHSVAVKAELDGHLGFAEALRNNLHRLIEEALEKKKLAS